MFIREIINVVSLVLVSLIAQGTFVFAGEEVYHLEAVSGESVIGLPEKVIDLKTIREKEERGLNLAKKAIKTADPYPGMKTEASRKTNEFDNLIERKKYLTITIQRLQLGLMKKKAEFARNPELLKVSVKQYSQKIKELEDELVEVEKQIPVLESKLASVNLELQVEELARGIMVNEENTGAFDEEFEEAIQERFNAGKLLLNHEF
jgi:predicted RNase H-like nuclease (RuvC/YqgF family)